MTTEEGNSPLHKSINDSDTRSTVEWTYNDEVRTVTITSLTIPIEGLFATSATLVVPSEEFRDAAETLLSISTGKMSGEQLNFIGARHRLIAQASEYQEEMQMIGNLFDDEDSKDRLPARVLEAFRIMRLLALSFTTDMPNG